MITDRIKEDGLELEFILPELRTKELCILAVHSNSKAIKYVPKEHQDMELCLFAVNDNQKNIKYVHDQGIRTAIIKSNPNVIRFVTTITKEMCDGYNGNLEYIPYELRTKDICLACVKMNARNIKHVPSNLLSEELYKIAIMHQRYTTIQFKCRTKTLSAMILDNILDGICSKKMFEQVPDEHISDEMYLKLAIRNKIKRDNCYSDQYYINRIDAGQCDITSVPKEYYTDKFITWLCGYVQKQKSKDLHDIIAYVLYVTDDIKRVRSKIYEILGLSYIPHVNQTYDICLDAIKKSVSNLEYCFHGGHFDVMWYDKNNIYDYIPVLKDSRFIPNVCLLALRGNGLLLGRIPRMIITKEMCDTAFKQNTDSIKFIPDKMMTIDMAMTAVRRNVNIFWCIPKEYQTDEMCRIGLCNKDNEEYAVYHYNLPTIYHIWYHEGQTYFKKNMSNAIGHTRFSDINLTLL
jgi:hypothetical protein